jgi:hypothetical protein
MWVFFPHHPLAEKSVLFFRNRFLQVLELVTIARLVSLPGFVGCSPEINSCFLETSGCLLQFEITVVDGARSSRKVPC